MTDLGIRAGSFFDHLVAIDKAHTQAEGNLRYLKAQEAVVLVGSAEKVFKVCHLMFSNTGGVFVQAPYFQDTEGLVGQLRWTRSEKDKVSAAFEPGWARATSHLVKLHHPPDGNAHFSQDGKVNTEIWLKTFPLATGKGYVFQLNMYGIEGHDYISPDTKLKKDRVYLPFLFYNGPIPDSITIFGEWLPKSQLGIGAGGPPKGPLVTYAESPGVEAPAFLLSPAGLSANENSLLRVTGGKAPPIPKLDRAAVVLRGAWSEGDPTGICLAFLYPSTDPEKSAATLGSIDRVPKVM